MRVFISWSGRQSQILAQALRDWLPLVLHYVQPWLSETDIEAGKRWSVEIAKQLEESNFGIICISRENIESSWILFEAGALAKSLQNSSVVPLLLNLEFREISGPLSQFQAKKLGKSAISEIVQSINQASATPVEKTRLKQLFEALWPQLEKQLEEIPRHTEDARPMRSQQDVLEELVSTVRSIDQRIRYLEQALPGSFVPNTVLLPVITTSQEIIPLDKQTEQKAKKLFREGNKINAIKLVREKTNLGLKEAKDIVDSWDTELPSAK
jgi:ribosomal protein L7/L12